MRFDDANLAGLAAEVGRRLLQRKLKLATAESCTGGWIAKCITDVAGSSEWFDRGFVTYSNAAKQAMLGVKEKTLAEHGSVSEATVNEMALGAVAHSGAQVAVAVSGIAGPDGGTPEKPVGTVWVAWAWPEGECAMNRYQFAGNREAVRRQAVAVALQGLVDGPDG
ncbi:MAG: nicotinamide-nucleotide amidase [Gammaproteobacteria bacterium]